MSSPRIALLALAFASTLRPAAAQPALFVDEPIACGMGLPYANCRATFDGWSLSIVYTNPEGRKSLALYRRCWGMHDLLHCAEGEWRSGNATGPLPGRGIGLRNGKPFPE
jgi:hypothetical protein